MYVCTYVALVEQIILLSSLLEMDTLMELQGAKTEN